MKKWLGQVKGPWRAAWDNKVFKRKFLSILVILGGIIGAMPSFMAYIQNRPGGLLDDPVLALLPPTDLSILIFAVIYISVVATVISLAKRPIDMLRGLWAYGLVLFFRVLSIYLVPLEPPLRMVVLVDPIVDSFLSGHEPITKDLFFSGHTSTMFLLYLFARPYRFKMTMLSLTALVGSALLLQHVHYTIDVLMAPIFTYISYLLAKWLVVEDKVTKTRSIV